MARTELTVQEIDSDGLDLTWTPGDATNDHSFEHLTEDIFFAVDNQGTGAVQVTIQTPLTVNGLAVADRVVSVNGGKTYLIGPFQKNLFNQEDTGNSIDETILVDLDQDSNVYVAAVRLPTL